MEVHASECLLLFMQQETANMNFFFRTKKQSIKKKKKLHIHVRSSYSKPNVVHVYFYK